jgi:hypothetical protein|tara:strand:- start:18187 stop:18525 length:339 start_codon:yes stop_codon:yes gene_type:complete
MHQITANSRGLARPNVLYKAQGDRPQVVFDFSLLFTGNIQTYTVKGDMPTESDSSTGKRVTLTLGAGQECRTYDLAVNATDGTTTREVTIQVKVKERERGWSADGCACGGYY